MGKAGSKLKKPGKKRPKSIKQQSKVDERENARPRSAPAARPNSIPNTMPNQRSNARPALTEDYDVLRRGTSTYTSVPDVRVVVDIKECPLCGSNCIRDLKSYTPGENKNRVVCQLCTSERGTTTAFCWNCVREWPAGSSTCNRCQPQAARSTVELRANIDPVVIRDIPIVERPPTPPPTGQLQPLPGHITLSKEPCCVTLDNSADEDRAKMPCGHVIGVEALQHQVDAVLKLRDYEIRCPECKADWPYFLVRHVLSAVLPTNELGDISKQINTNFIAKASMQECPTCGFNCERNLTRYGSGENRNVTVCRICSERTGRTSAFCWSCSRPWVDINSFQACGNDNCDTVWKIRDLAQCGTKTIGRVTGCPTIRGCPRCGCIIHHIDACKHVKCTECKTPFCFVCLKPMLNGNWQCGLYSDVCPLAPRQTSLPE